MVVREFDVFRSVLSPDEADAELIVHANGMLSISVTLQGFQPITWRGTKVLQGDRRVQVLKFAAGDLEQIGREALCRFAFEGCPGQIVLEALDHKPLCITY